MIDLDIRKRENLIAEKLRFLNLCCYACITSIYFVLFFVVVTLLLLNKNAYAEVEPLSVSGNRVLVGGVPKSLAGNSFFWSNNGWGGERYYNASIVSWLKSDWQSSIVRAAMGVDESGGYLQYPEENTAKVRAVIDAAIENDMYVIIDWHSHHAEDYRPNAISFFQQMAREYGHFNNVIYEIYNEPLEFTSWDHTIKPYAEAVIAAIRAIDPDNLIVVGTRQWSQRVDEVARNPITSHVNIAYTLHFYAATHFDKERGWAQEALNNGIALFATEWGTVNNEGKGRVNYQNTDAWMTFLLDNKISHANWSIHDKEEGASALFPGASTSGGWQNLTASGTKVKDVVTNWPDKIGGGLPAPGNCSRVTIPAKIQAEEYCHMSGVRSEPTSDVGGGNNIGFLDASDWMTYDVDVPASGVYEVSYRIASDLGGGFCKLNKLEVHRYLVL